MVCASFLISSPSHLSKDINLSPHQDIFESHPLPALQSALIEYYSQRIKYHAQELACVEKGKTDMEFFKFDKCGDVISGRRSVHQFVNLVDKLSYSTDFYSGLKAKLTSKELFRIVEQLAHILRPIQGAEAFCHVAQQCLGFGNIKVILLNSLASRKVKAWPLPKEDFPVTRRMEVRISNKNQKRKNVHAEMRLMTYLLGFEVANSNISPYFPYLGVSKRTCPSLRAHASRDGPIRNSR
ncbi:hypothetical protein BGW36DRAFT_363599 [Talaromyces proteolyticus]|uniref:Uncharacterized protein n=1 Tax=Talaromyces proteolyticus TaxID=1131652 RepID=A0AAD4KHD9_9EURO|nr:uncharacterized protein BGW36DRAFT_363599 [Talaromyces proteolyticus]KAH8691262.1 hypothetical protein BGW36DRAFT_363599 [Talaromyces proteolyticus]